MPVIAVVNRKGGCGKSTLATHLAAYCANAGMSVMLGDVDQQQSAKTWLKLRTQHLPAEKHNILGWVVEPTRGMRPPLGTSHVVLDTPGGMTGFELARVALYADVIVMPVCDSVFDRDATERCLAELRALPRVSSGRCKLAAVGMRVQAKSHAAQALRAWTEQIELPLIGTLSDTQLYVQCAATGRALFDLAPGTLGPHLRQWAPILDWLAPVLATPTTVSPLLPSSRVVKTAASHGAAIAPVQAAPDRRAHTLRATGQDAVKNLATLAIRSDVHLRAQPWRPPTPVRHLLGLLTRALG